jgi:hypothetical protein
MVRSRPLSSEQGELAMRASRRLGRKRWRGVLSVSTARPTDGGLLQERVLSEQMVRLTAGAVKACVSGEVLALGRSVPEDAVEELLDEQGLGLDAAIAVVGVLEADGGSVEIQRTVLGKGPTLDIASKVEGHTAAMLIDIADVDMEVDAVKGADDAAPVRAILLGWQGQLLLRQEGAELGEELAAEQALEGQGGDGDV